MTSVGPKGGVLPRPGTYFVVCQACDTALLENQSCHCEWDPPLEPWEDSERTRAHSRQMLVYRAELIGTAADLEGERA